MPVPPAMRQHAFNARTWKPGSVLQRRLRSLIKGIHLISPIECSVRPAWNTPSASKPGIAKLAFAGNLPVHRLRLQKSLRSIRIAAIIQPRPSGILTMSKNALTTFAASRRFP